LSGARAAVAEATTVIQKELTGFPRLEVIEDPEQVASFWRDLRERRLDFFSATAADGDSNTLWRLSIPPATPAFSTDTLPGECLIDWAGAQRWLRTLASSEVVQAAAQAMGGHASRFAAEGVLLAPLSPVLATMHQRMKQAFDPGGILNPGRLYEGL
jgi:glycolate oxidase FAD binding subunit